MSKAGFRCSIKRGGVPTTTVSEAFTNVTGNVYQITSDAKRLLDPTASWHLSDGAGTISYASVATIDFMFGEVVVPGVSGTLRFTGTYIPLGSDASTVVGEAYSHTLTESSTLNDKTSYSATTGFRKRIYGLADAQVSFDLFLNATDFPRLATLHSNAQLCYLEIASGYSPVFRGIGLIDSLERTADVDGIVEASVSWQLAAQRDANTGYVIGYSERNIVST